MLTTRLAAPLAALFLLCGTAAAEASVSAQLFPGGIGPRLHVTGTSGDDHIVAEKVGEDIRVSVGPGETIHPAGACTAVSAQAVTCPLTLDGEMTSDVTLNGWDGDDSLDAQTVPAGIGADLNGGNGVDRLYGSAGNDFVEGGMGEDEVEALGGDDILQTAPGDGNDTQDGGPGRDWADYGSRTDGMEVHLGGWLYSGGVLEDAIGGVEDFTGGKGEDTIFGNGEANRLVGSLGGDQLLGGGGDDELYGGAGDDELRGQDGDDRLEGAGDSDSFHGGDGDDRLEARDGELDVISCDGAEPDAVPGTQDVLDGDAVDTRPADCDILSPRFTGTPSISGTLRAGSTLTITGLDHVGDPAPTITVTWQTCATPEWDDCQARGIGPELVLTAADVGRHVTAWIDLDNGAVGGADLDLTDAVLPALVAGGKQEQQQATQGGGSQDPTASAGTGVTPPASQQAAPSQRVRAVLGGARTLKVRKGVVAVPFTAGAAGAVDVRALRGRTALAAGRRTFAGAGTAVLKVRLSKAARATLARKGRVRATVRATFTPAGSAAIVVERTVTLKR